LHDSTETDFGLSYLFERGHKRQRRLQAAKDITAVTRSQVADSERQLTFQVATLFFNAQLAESTLSLAQQDLKSFQRTVDIGEREFKTGGISENDYLKIQLQLLQYQGDLEQALVAREQSLSDLRQLLGYESVGADYDVEASFNYQPIKLGLEDLQLKALQDRPDLRAAQQGVTAAGSQYALEKANGKQDVTGAFTYSHVNSINTGTLLVSVPLPFFNRNQGEIERTRLAITQAQELQLAANGQVLTDVKDAYEGFQSNDRVVQLYLSRYLAVAQKSRDISEHSYHRGATALLDFLDSERTYRSVQLAYRQSLASYLLALEQVREAVGTRTLP
jgi:outer membrane protein, heavy metal efflux system